jgi:hypothetical protein
VAVLDADDPVGEPLEARIVGDDDDGAALAGGELAQELHHRQRGAGVERGGRLVADQDRRIAAERARDRDALLLAARQVGGQLVHARAEADPLEQLPGLGVGVAGARVLHPDRDRDVLDRGQRWEQVEALEHEAEVAGAQRGQLALAEPGDVLALEPDLAGGRREQQAEDRDQRGLARARRALDQHDLAGVDVEAGAGERGDRVLAVAVGLGDPDHAGQRRGRGRGGGQGPKVRDELVDGECDHGGPCRSGWFARG